MGKLLRDPLGHFLLAGLGLFLLYALLSPESAPEEDPMVIAVDRPALLNFIQYRTKRFDPEQAGARLDGLSEKARTDLINDYVREEALHREALALGLDADDYVIRRRLVQKVEFMAQGVAQSDTPPDEQTLRDWYEANLDRYAAPAQITFTHVYYSSEQRGEVGALALARGTLARLNSTGAVFTDAPRYGERFLYNLNYVDRPRADIVDHFGPAMASAVFNLAPSLEAWHGPYQSPHGSHLVMVTNIKPAGVPPFEEVRDRVRQDVVAETGAERQAAVIDEVLARYEVKIDLEPAAPETPEATP